LLRAEKLSTRARIENHFACEPRRFKKAPGHKLLLNRQASNPCYLSSRPDLH
jgi:hypothetical protein